MNYGNQRYHPPPPKRICFVFATNFFCGFPKVVLHDSAKKIWLYGGKVVLPWRLQCNVLARQWCSTILRIYLLGNLLSSLSIYHLISYQFIIIPFSIEVSLSYQNKLEEMKRKYFLLTEKNSFNQVCHERKKGFANFSATFCLTH